MLTRSRLANADPIGRPIDELLTPALLLDLDLAKQNIARMAEWIAGQPTELRPHIKVHKCVELSRLQVAAGAVGVACATIWEAAAMVDGGIEDVMIVNEVIGAQRLALLPELADRARLSVIADDATNIAELARVAADAGVTIGVLVDLDVGMRRCGARSPDEAVTLAEMIAAAERLEFRGVMGYEGHCMNEPDPALRRTKQLAATAIVQATVDALAAHGLRCEIVAGGGTGTFPLTGTEPVMTELHAGSYVVMDVSHELLIPGRFATAMHVLGTMISRHGTAAVLDTGRKAVSPDAAMPSVALEGVGTRFIAEEHLGITLPPGSPLRVGDKVKVIGGYAPTTVNLHGRFFVIQDDKVVDVWRVQARHGTPEPT